MKLRVEWHHKQYRANNLVTPAELILTYIRVIEAPQGKETIQLALPLEGFPHHVFQQLIMLTHKLKTETMAWLNNMIVCD